MIWFIISAGAGMGIDSGLPDFRGPGGFWRAYPMYEALGLNFTAMANPAHFIEDPAFAWGFYGHRTKLYRDTIPHAGFAILLRWINQLKLEWFVLTSNVDGQFQKAGFASDQIVEIHGSIHHMQCLAPCTPEIWLNHELFPIDSVTMRSEHVPLCINCGGTARPNILMFNDWCWVPGRSNEQQHRFDQFLTACTPPITIMELGAGRALPTIRWTGESLAKKHAATLIRVNPYEPEIAAPHISIACGAAGALAQIDEVLQANSSRNKEK